ncbi:MAG TPA: hypothetical protein VIY09_06935, partial [Rhizomicrobium sp.]
PANFLRQIGQAGERPNDIATAALMLSALDNGARDLEPYAAGDRGAGAIRGSSGRQRRTRCTGSRRKATLGLQSLKHRLN